MKPITKAEIEQFKKDVFLSGDEAQEFAEEDKLFRGESALRWQIRAYMEWLYSPCTEHGIKAIHANCDRCKKIAYEAVRS